MGSRFNHLAFLALAGGALLLTGAPATVSAAPPSAASSAMIPPAEFVKKVNMRNPRIAPDGKHFAYVTGAGGKEVLVVMDLTAPTKPPVTVMSAAEAREAGERTMTEFRWVGSENIVITVIAREDLGRVPGDFRRLVAYNLASGKLVLQAWRGSGGDAGRILHIDHAKGEFLLERDGVTQDTESRGLPEVVRVNVATGDYTMVQRTNPIVTGGWAADSDGVVRAGFASDGENGKTRILYRSNEKQPFHTVFNQADKSFTENIPIPQQFIPGTDQAYVISRSDGFGKVYKMDLTTLKLSAPVRGMELISGSLQPLSAGSLDAFAGLAGGGGRDTAPQLVERLRARLGDEAVYGVRSIPEHRPEAAWRSRRTIRPNWRRRRSPIWPWRIEPRQS